MAAYDDLPDGVVVAGPDGRVIFVNTSAERMLRTGRADAVGLPYTEVLPLVDADGRDWWECTDPYGGLHIRTRQQERVLSFLRGPRAGDQFYVAARYVRDGRHLAKLVVSLRSSTGRERADRDRADLVATVAHELRAPLTSVKGFTATLLTKWDRFTDEQRKHMLATVNADADRVTRLIHELLDVARIEAGRLELRRQVVDLPALVQKVFAAQQATGIPAERFLLKLEGVLPEVWADPDKITQVLGNLVENGVRHGMGTVTVTVASTDAPGLADSTIPQVAAPQVAAPQVAAPQVMVRVADEGAGLPEDLMPRLFRKFSRGDRRRGTGLGLYVAKGVVAAHGGMIEAGRGPSGGAEFRFTLPAGTPEHLR
jgi:signal transduction histidine kinase